MKYKNWDDFKVHCSAISKIMARPRGCNDLTKRDLKYLNDLVEKEEKAEDDFQKIEFYKQKRAKFLNPPLSEAAKWYLTERYSAEKYNIRRASTGGLQRPSIQKGVGLEKEGVELVSAIDGINYQRPKGKVTNEYMIGLCDILCYENKKLVDIKTSWNSSGFMGNRRAKKLTFQQWCQIQGYLELYNIDFGQVCHVLVNTPPHLVEQEKAIIFKKYTHDEITRDEYEEKLESYDCIFDFTKIPAQRRVIRLDVPRYKEFMPMVYAKVEMSRVWLNEFERDFMANKNILTLPEDYINATTEDNIESNTTDPCEGDPRG